MSTIITLAPGQNSFYDSISGIHLTVDSKEAKVSSKANIEGLLNAVKDGKILVVSGSLEAEALAYQESLKAIPTYYRLLAKKQKQIVRQNIVKSNEISEPVKETKEVPAETKVKTEVIVETVIEEPAVTEAAAEEVTEEVVTPKKKATRKKKVAETKED